MPSSLIWVALVAGWILVLFPMVSGSRKPVSRTSAATEETRVLHRGGKPRPVRRGPAAGHLSDPQWQPSPEEQSRRFGASSTNPKTTRAEAQMDSAATDSDEDRIDGPAPVVASAARVLDAVVVGEEGDDSAGSPPEDVVEQTAEMNTAEMNSADQVSDEEPVSAEDEGPIKAVVPTDVPVPRTGRGGFDPEADAAAHAIRYRNRQRTVIGLGAATVVTLASAFMFSSMFAWAAVVFGTLFVAYMSYLRQQVRMEKQIRERRLARLKHSRRAEVAERRAEHTVPGNARRFGAVVLEADDEDPSFEHLPHYESTVRHHETRAAG